MYKEVACKNHPKVRPNGCVHEHILVAEGELGFIFMNGEVVHHINENKLDNRPENLMVFRSQSEHIRFHTGVYEKLEQLDSGVWICTMKKRYCEHCGKELNESQVRNGARFCSTKCHSITNRVCERPTKEELNDLLSKNSFVKVGKIFNVSDNAIRNWCKGYGMSTKAKDYK